MELNVIFMGDFLYPKGMAGTKRIQHAIDAFNENRIECSVIVNRQSTKMNPPKGVYKGTQYITLMPDLIGWRLAIFLFVLIFKSLAAIHHAFKDGKKNILFIYGPPFLSNIVTVLYAKKRGYFIVFDIVEDEDHAKCIAKDWRHRSKTYINRYLTNRINKFADGVVVISCTLENKFRRMTHGLLPLHYRPVSIDPKRFQAEPNVFTKNPTMFYSGSFGTKDGISELIDAFEDLANKYPLLKLVMTGKGTEQRMKDVLERIKASPARERIEYKGYVDDEKYYKLLAEADIPCMTRINDAYANAGFPFKLGEFLATGKPVIASNVSDVGKVVNDRRDGMLVKPSASDDIILAVEYLLANPEKAVKIGERGREKAFKLFDYRIQGDSLLRFLRTL